MTLQERLQLTENLLESKINDFGKLEIVRQKAFAEINEMRGQIELLKQMMREEESTDTGQSRLLEELINEDSKPKI